MTRQLTNAAVTTRQELPHWKISDISPLSYKRQSEKVVKLWDHPAGEGAKDNLGKRRDERLAYLLLTEGIMKDAKG
uniref:Uncharacterized protein n=1 Tax=Pristionchus pacificus TaxID=54126 RepID=A0A2A6BI77_PRIPA|eukprot:PDM65625.1 hypothetical protein PRIPAC_53633 [Pristionchus pacificus]